MRADIKKLLFVGAKKDYPFFFDKAQSYGLIHFINTEKKLIHHFPTQIQPIAKAIRIVLTLPVTDQEEENDFSKTDDIVDSILKIKEQIDKLIEETRILKLEMARVEVFGDFSKDDIDSIEKESKRKVQFYCAKKGFFHPNDLPIELIYIASENNLDYYFALNNEEKQFPKMIEIKIDQPIGKLKESYQSIAHEIQKHENLLKSYAKYNSFLHKALLHKLNSLHLEEAKKCSLFPLEEDFKDSNSQENETGLFVVFGYVEANKMEKLGALLEETHTFAEVVALNPDENLPTALQNESLGKIGEDLVKIYDTPSQTDKDPSLWVVCFFALFFSMIIGDGGYGLILLLVALFIRYKHQGLKDAKKRFLDLFTILGFSCIIWGVATTSFFGITISPDNPIRKVSLMSWMVEKKVAYHIQHQDKEYQDWITQFPKLKNEKDPHQFVMQVKSVNKNGNVSYDLLNHFSDTILMEMALFVGVIHVIISMLRYIGRNPQNIGWIVFILGAYLYIPVFVDTPSFANFIFGVDQKIASNNGLYLIYGGIALASLIAIFKNKWLGLLEPSVLVQIFGDVLSYLRLYALALSGSLLTATMNELSGTVPFVLGVVILVIGHLVNIILGIMGGVIHGLRLNFLEWYHYSFEGGGKLFTPLKKLK